MQKVRSMTPESLFTLQVIRTVVDLMIETLERDQDAARYDDLCQRLWSEFEALRTKEGN